MAKRKAVEQGEAPENNKRKRAIRADYMQFKCNLHGFWTIIDKHRNDIGKETWSKLKKTPFWGFIEPFYKGKVTKEQISKSDELIGRLIQFYDSKNAYFQFGESRLQIVAADVQHIFGVTNHGKHLDVVGRKAKGISDMIVRYFGKCDQNVRKSDIDSALQKAITEGGKAEDVTKLLIMSLLASFFLCASGHTLGWNIVNVISADLKSLGEYNWAQAIVDFLGKGLSKVEKDKTCALSGCLLLIMYWVCEKTGITTPIPEREDNQPTFVKWGLPKLHAAMLEVSNEYFEGLFKQRPDNEDVNQEETNEEVDPAPTFAEWTFPSSQEMKDELQRTSGAMNSILDNLESATKELDKGGVTDAQALVRQLQRIKRRLKKRIKTLRGKIEELEKEKFPRYEDSSDNPENEGKCGSAEPCFLENVVDGKEENPTVGQQLQVVPYVEAEQTPLHPAVNEEMENASSVIMECLDDLNKAETPAVRKLRGDKRKITKDTENYIFDTPDEIKGRKAVIKSPPKASYKLKGVKCTMIHWKNLSLKEQEMVQKYWEDASDDDQFWDGEGFGNVSRPDVKALLEGGPIKSNVVDAYLEIVKNDLIQSGNHKQGILTSYVLKLLKGDETKDGSKLLQNETKVGLKRLQQYLYDPLSKLLGCCDNIFIPLITTEDFHYTMLRLNKKAHRWVHYNPKRKGKAERSTGYKNALEVVEAVSKWMHEVKRRYRKVGEGYQKLVDKDPEPGMIHKVYESCHLDDEELKTMDLIFQSDIQSWKLVEDEHCLQQPANSLDCGPYILNYIENIAKDRLQMSTGDRHVWDEMVLYTEKLAKEGLKNMRRTILERFLNHEHGWYSKLGDM